MRMTQEHHGTAGGVQTVLVRIPCEAPSQTEGSVEVTVLVRVPAIESDAQVETAAREMAKRALHEALSRFP